MYSNSINGSLGSCDVIISCHTATSGLTDVKPTRQYLTTVSVFQSCGSSFLIKSVFRRVSRQQMWFNCHTLIKRSKLKNRPDAVRQLKTADDDDKNMSVHFKKCFEQHTQLYCVSVQLISTSTILHHHESTHYVVSHMPFLFFIMNIHNTQANVITSITFNRSPHI